MCISSIFLFVFCYCQVVTEYMYNYMEKELKLERKVVPVSLVNNEYSYTSLKFNVVLYFHNSFSLRHKNNRKQEAFCERRQLYISEYKSKPIDTERYAFNFMKFLVLICLHL